MLQAVFADQPSPQIVSTVPRIPIAEPMATEIMGPPLWPEDSYVEARGDGKGALMLAITTKPKYDLAKGDSERPGVTARKMAEAERWLTLKRLTVLVNAGLRK